jgi:hypothetical protein
MMSFWNKQIHSKSKDWKGNKRPKKYQIVGIIPKSNRKIVERGKIDTHKYMTACFPGLVQALQ